MTGRRLLVVFLDGVGIGTNDPALNPFLRAELPTLLRLFGGIPTLTDPRLQRAGGDGTPPAVVFPVDATLGHEGTPQSGTGQSSLLTGINAADLFGRHFGPWVPTALREVVREQSFLRRSVQAGRSTAFLNAYPEGWPGERRARRVAGPPLAAQGAGLLTRTHHDVATGEAISNGITNEGWLELGLDHLPQPSAREVGKTLVGLALRHQLSLYAHWATDTAGHRGGMAGAIAALEKVDQMLAGVLDGWHDELDLLICSDHGNVEDVSGGHTRNPSLGALIGEAARAADPAAIRELPAVCDFVLGHQGIAGD